MLLPTLMSPFPSSTKTIPASYLLPLQWSEPHNDEILIVMEEDVFEEKDKESVWNLVKLIDKSNGYIFSGIDASVVEYSKIAVGQIDWDYNRVAAVQEKYMKDDESQD